MTASTSGRWPTTPCCCTIAPCLTSSGAGFRLQRVAYPALAYAFAAGQAGVLPWSLLAINIIAVLGITAGFARWAARRGISPWWALAVGLLPGFVVATVGDMSDVIATGAMLGGLMLWQGGRRWPAAGLLALATLAREPMILAAGAVAVEAAAHAWRSRARAGAALGDRPRRAGRWWRCP